jgi:cellulose synthase/poly-beta-1,6-N-acetylglucosamine synthase-like glycosyltransferase
MWTALFLLSAAAIMYVYVGYSVLIPLLAFFSRKPVRIGEIEPKVTFLITAYNEEKNIRRKLEEVLELDYPGSKMEVLVASDGSTDRTDEIVRKFAGRGVILTRIEGRVGKTATQNEAVMIAGGDIIIFSDATTTYRKDAVRKIVRNYHDPAVGAVSGRYEYVNPSGAPVGIGTIIFWKYENYIKSMQTRIKTITGCCGCIYSVRRAAYVPLAPDIISDLVEPLRIVEKGYRVVFEPEAVAYETTTERPSEEFRMRIRIINRAMRGIWSVRGLLNPLRHPFVSFQLLSHKVLRWMVPFFLVTLFVSNSILLGEPFYNAVFAAQAVCYGAALAGLALGVFGMRIRPLAIPLYFCVVNAASLIAFFKTLTGRKTVVWETVRK